MKSSIENLDSLANGALTERFGLELKKVLDNIYDPNTDPTKVRKVVLELKIKSNERRTQAELSLSAKSTFAPTVPVVTDLFMKMDYASGTVYAEEITQEIPGQIGMDGQTTEPKKVEFN